MADVKTRDFVPASGAAMQDANLRRALRQVGGGFNEARLDAIEEVSWEAWEEWREEARRIKIHALENLDYYLELLHDRVTTAGGHVHFARDSAQANSIVAEIARSRNVKIATKSKSMVSEELDLNHTWKPTGLMSTRLTLVST